MKCASGRRGSSYVMINTPRSRALEALFHLPARKYALPTSNRESARFAVVSTVSIGGGGLGALLPPNRQALRTIRLTGTSAFIFTCCPCLLFRRPMPGD